MKKKERKEFRKLLGEAGPLIVPGVYNSLTAKVAQGVGFPAAFVSGFSIAGSLLGEPDVGLISLGEMIHQIRYITSAVTIPIIADADTGYGNPINVRRTVQEYERIGVSGLLLEDQTWPKKCGHMEGKNVIAKGEMVQKIKAAVDAREDPNLVIVARTDACFVLGIEEAIERSQACREAGADVIFIEAPAREEEVERIAEAFKSVPLLFNVVIGGKTPYIPISKLEELGYKLILFPIDAILASTKAVMELMHELKQTKTTLGFTESMIPFHQFNDFVGLSETRLFEKRYSAHE